MNPVAMRVRCTTDCAVPVVAFWCALVAVFFCAWSWIQNTWAASFGEAYQSAYMHRAEASFWLLCLTFGVTLILAWKWIRPSLNSIVLWVKRRGIRPHQKAPGRSK